jgi:hypothetical protein
MRPCVRPLLVPKRAKSTPILGERSSNSELPGRRGARAFFVYGFAKSQRANINEDEEQQFKEAAKIVLSLTENALAVRLERGDFVEAKSE